jgi:predicted transcriptional regulator
MTSIRDILAYNLKENRKKCGLSQAKLAEKANITTQYIAMIEVSRKFPTPEDAMERLHDTLVGNIERVVATAIEKSIATNCKK